MTETWQTLIGFIENLDGFEGYTINKDGLATEPADLINIVFIKIYESKIIMKIIKKINEFLSNMTM